MRVGFGYDVHRLVQGRSLVLGGVIVPYHLGLEGHSDADVLVHAIMDALLGACGLGDIGRHFPDTDKTYRDISSLILLGRVKEVMAAGGFAAHNLDSVIVAQSPRLAEHIIFMQQNIAAVLALSPGFVNIKATTTEGLGFAGIGQGIAAYAVATVNCAVV